MVDKEYEEDQEKNPESKVEFLQWVFRQDFHRKIAAFFSLQLLRPKLLTFVFLRGHVNTSFAKKFRELEFFATELRESVWALKRKAACCTSVFNVLTSAHQVWQLNPTCFMLQKISFLSLQMFNMESGVINFFPNGRIIFLLALSKKSIYKRCQCCPSAQHDDKAFEGRVPQKFWGNTDPASLFTEI